MVSCLRDDQRFFILTEDYLKKEEMLSESILRINEAESVN